MSTELFRGGGFFGFFCGGFLFFFPLFFHVIWSLSWFLTQIHQNKACKKKLHSDRLDNPLTEQKKFIYSTIEEHF